MVSQVIRLAAIISILLSMVTAARAVDDKSSEKRILAVERNRVEKLIVKAKYLESAGSDSCVVIASEAMHLSRAYNAPELQVRAQAIIGDYYFHKEKYREALAQYGQMLSLYTETADSAGKANCYNVIGLSYFNLGVYDKAIRSFHSAMQIAVALDLTDVKAKCNQNIGVLYYSMQRPDDAMSYYRKALDLNRLLKDKGAEADIMQNIGNIYEDERKFKDALGYYLSALKIYEGLKDSLSLGSMYLSLGSLYEDRKDLNRSLEYYNKSLVISKKENHILGIAYGYTSLGSVYNKKNEYAKALKYLQEALKFSRQISLVENEADCHQLLSVVYFNSGDYLNAYHEKKEYEELHDSIYSQNLQEQIAETELKYQSKLKDAEIVNLKMEREKAVRYMIRRTIGLSIIVILTILIIAVTGYYNRIMQKANAKLLREVEERTKAQQELMTIKENLEVRVTERTKELEKAKIKAEESDKLKSAFIANMSHEIRTPLNAITGFSGLLLREDISSEKKQEYNDQIIKNNRILVNMIENLIDTSRIESGSLQLHPSTVNPDQILAQLNEPIYDNMAKKNKPYIEIIQEKADIHTPTIYADAVRVHQVLWHLLDNAIKFTNKGTIRYGCYENHSNMIFYVNDTGIGISEEFKTVIFEKFRQLDESARRKYGGTGLGLYYALKIAEMMGGTIWFDSKPEGGSIFYFSLPVTQK